MNKFNFFLKKSYTIGIILSQEDGEKIERLARKYRCTKCAIASEIVRVGLKEIKDPNEKDKEKLRI